MSDKIKEYDEEGRVIRENRSAIKRERETIRQFAEELLKLPSHQYSQLPITEQLIAALIEGKRLSGNPLRRHLNYLTRLLDEHEIDKIRHVHEYINHPYHHDSKKMRRIEQEIERLMENDSDIYGELFAFYADIDLQYIRQTVREAQKHLQQAQEQSADETSASSPKSKTDKYRRRLQKYLQTLALNYPDSQS